MVLTASTESQASDAQASSDAVLMVIQGLLDDLSGKSVPITRDTRIDRYFNDVCGADSLEYLHLTFSIEDALNIRLSDEDWRFLAGAMDGLTTEEWELRYAPFFTFGRLADLVAHRAKIVAIRPITILGSTSKAAGAFRFIQDALQKIVPHVKSFGPSTPIVDRVPRWKLSTFWAVMRGASGNRVPPLPKGRTSVVAFTIIGTLVAFGLGALALGAIEAAMRNVGPFANRESFREWVASSLVIISLAAIPISIIAYILQFFLPVVKTRGSLLPPGVCTFRDLAYLIGGERGGRCKQCSYDMTENTTGRCPECGSATSATCLPRAPIVPNG